MKSNHPSFFASVCTAAICVSGCTNGIENWGNYLPTAEYDHIDITHIDFTQVDSELVFALDNPLPIGVEVTTLDYVLYLNDIDILEGTDNDGFSLGAESVSDLPLPISLEYAEVFELVQATRGSDTFNFALDAQIGFETYAGPVEIPMFIEGEMPALRAPKMRFDSLSVDDLHWDTLDLTVDLEMDNDLGSTLWFESMDVELTAEGSDLASTQLEGLGGVSGSNSEILSLPVEVDLWGVATTAVNAITNEGEVVLGMNGEAWVDTPFGLAPLDIDHTGDINIW